jgi:tetratricopeptide (TPR) repeat protein
MAAGYVLRKAGGDCIPCFARAVSAASEAARLAPEDPRHAHTQAVLLYELARTKADTGRISNAELQEVLAATDQAIAKNPKGILTRETKTVLLILCSRHWQGTPQERETFARRAIEHCRGTLAIDPTFFMARANEAECFVNLGRVAMEPQERRAALDEALRLTSAEVGSKDEREWAFTLIRAEALLLLGRMDEARQFARRAKAVRPGAVFANPELFEKLK